MAGALENLMWVNQPAPQNASPLEMLLNQPDAFDTAAQRTRNGVRPQGGRSEGLATRLPEAVLQSLMTLPQRAGEEALRHSLGEREDLQAIPEAAMLTLGAPGVGTKQALAMDAASRMERARSMGFNVEEPLYHGTATSFNRFNLNKAGSVEGSGGERAVFLTPDANTAYQYAQSAGIMKNSGGKGYVKAGTDEALPGQQIYPLYVKPGKQKVIEGGRSDGTMMYDDGNFADHIAEARKGGYDSIRFKNVGDVGGRSDQIAVLDPNNIRSQFARFDPENKSSQLLGTGIYRERQWAPDPKNLNDAWAQVELDEKALRSMQHTANMAEYVGKGPSSDFRQALMDAEVNLRNSMAQAQKFGDRPPVTRESTVIEGKADTSPLGMLMAP